MYSTLATLVLALHILFIVWIVLGALAAGKRPVQQILHIASLIWGVVMELSLPYLLTLLENILERHAGVEPYQGAFLEHYLDKLVYLGLGCQSSDCRRCHRMRSESRVLFEIGVEQVRQGALDPSAIHNVSLVGDGCADAAGSARDEDQAPLRLG